LVVRACLASSLLGRLLVLLLRDLLDKQRGSFSHFTRLVPGEAELLAAVEQGGGSADESENVTVIRTSLLEAAEQVVVLGALRTVLELEGVLVEHGPEEGGGDGEDRDVVVVSDLALDLLDLGLVAQD